MFMFVFIELVVWTVNFQTELVFVSSYHFARPRAERHGILLGHLFLLSLLWHEIP